MVTKVDLYGPHRVIENGSTIRIVVQSWWIVSAQNVSEQISLEFWFRVEACKTSKSHNRMMCGRQKQIRLLQSLNTWYVTSLRWIWMQKARWKLEIYLARVEWLTKIIVTSCEGIIRLTSCISSIFLFLDLLAVHECKLHQVSWHGLSCSMNDVDCWDLLEGDYF